MRKFAGRRRAEGQETVTAGVTQRHEGFPHGECVRASYATLLGLDVDLVPRLDPGALLPGETQRGRERRWLASLGLALDERAPVGPAPRGWHLVRGLSPRGPHGHCCVGYRGRVAWDPHPSRAGLREVWSFQELCPDGARR